MKNYLILKGFSPFRMKCVFVDTQELLYKKIFRNAGIRVTNTWEYKKEGTRLRLIICHILRKDKEVFEKAVMQIRDKAFLLGFSDYDEACELLQGLAKGEEHD